MHDQGHNMSWNVVEAGTAEFPPGSEVALTLVDCLRNLPGRRAVWHAKLNDSGPGALLKIYQKHPKQERDLGKEWDNSRKLVSAGLPLPRPLFVAESGEDVAIAFEFIEDGTTVGQDQLLGDDDQRDELLRQLVEIHSQAHAAGCYQSDNHLGNYLWGSDQLWILDAGSYVFGPAPLPGDARRKNLAMLEASLPLASGKHFRAALAAAPPEPTGDMAKAVRIALRERQRSYFKKTRRSCTEFEHVRERGFDWLACCDIDPGLREALQDDPDQFFGKEGWLKKGNTSSVVEIEFNQKPYILKRYNRKSLLYRWMHALSTPRARTSWTNGHVLRLFGIPTPRPIACMLAKRGLLVHKAYLLMEKAHGISLTRVARQGEREQLPAALEGFSRRWRELDLLQATHGDMKASNFILDDDGELHLIDLDGLVFHHSRHALKRGQRRDLRRFLQNWQSHPETLVEIKRRIGAE